MYWPRFQSLVVIRLVSKFVETQSEWNLLLVVFSSPRPSFIGLKASLSFPGSPFDGRRRSSQPICSITWARNGKKYGDRKPLVLDTSFHVQDQDQIPFADADSGESDVFNHSNNHNNHNYNNHHHHRDDSVVRYLECDEDEGCDENDEQAGLDGSDPLITPVVYINSSQLHSRHSSYTSHSSRLSYSSHGGDGGGGHKGLPNWTKRSDSLRSKTKIISPGPLIYNEVMILSYFLYFLHLNRHNPIHRLCPHIAITVHTSSTFASCPA